MGSTSERSKAGIVYQQVNSKTLAQYLRVQIQGSVRLGKIGGDHDGIDVMCLPQLLRF